jgi:hypothetical protein
MFLFAFAVALILKFKSMRFGVSFMFTGIGFAAHMFEDALVFNPAYAFFWPLSGQKFGIGIIEYRADLYGIANTDVLIVGVIGIMLCLGISAAYDGKDGIQRSVKAFGMGAAVLMLMVPMFMAMDIKVLEKDNFYAEKGYINKWKFTSNASWDITIFNNGGHSAKIEIPGNESKISGIWMSDKIAVKPNTTYVFSAWGKTDGAGGNNSPAVRVVELSASNNSINQINLVFRRETNDWTQKQVRFITRANTSSVYIYANIWKGYGTFWLDDVELYDEVSSSNLIPNGGFEENCSCKI